MNLIQIILWLLVLLTWIFLTTLSVVNIGEDDEQEK